MDTIAEEKTTLPEGYTISVACMSVLRKAGGVHRFTQLTAYRGNITEVMRVDDVSAHSLRRYLDLVIKEIQRQRDRIIKKPTMLIKSPKTIEEFVINMAGQGFFILTPWNAEQPNEDNYNAETGHTKSGPAKKTVRKLSQTSAHADKVVDVPKKKQPKKTKSVTPTNGEHIPF